jgi:NAD(P)-dependent dehydrogenase (short-subunit alcohol dehydrogenase family)
MIHESSKRTIVIGGSSGIGRATAELLAGLGHEVLAIARDPEKLAELERDSAAAGAPVSTRAADAGDASVMHQAFAAFGAFDHLVLTPSSARGMGPLASLDLAELLGGFEGKYWPNVIALQAALPTLHLHGSITIVTGASSGAAFPGTSGLAAINGALDAMVPVLAVELAPRRVNAVSPGVIDTAWWNAIPRESRDSFFAQFASKAPAGRVGRAADVAGAVEFLIANTFVTGNVLKVDGGARFTA